jgi:aspartyl-tRNA(Asn)/glutamyl-tRNA(Gln) amidotransferase subunit B
VEKVRSEMTELPRVMAARFVADYGLSEYDATALTQSRAMAAYFEATTQVCKQAKLASNWIMGEVTRLLNHFEIGIEAVPVSATRLAALICRIHENVISNSAAKQLLESLWNASGDEISDEGAPSIIDALIESKGLKQMNDSSELEKIVDDILAANPKNVEEYKGGNAKALNALVGQIMKGSKGKANPQQVNDLLRKKLG